MIIKIIKLLIKVYTVKPKKTKKVGRPDKYSDFQICMILILMVMKNILSYSGIIKYLKTNKPLCKIMGLNEIPNRTTLSRRVEGIQKKLREIIQRLGNYYCIISSVRVFFASLDSTLIKSKGPLWHRKHRNLGIIPLNLTGVDTDSKWGFSKVKGWIQGYKAHFNVVFDIKNNLIPFPIDAVVTTANIPDIKKCRTITSHLNEKVLVEFGDKGYDDEDFFIEMYKKGILFSTPIKKNAKLNGINSLRYIYNIVLNCLGFNHTRNTTIEPFNSRMKELFNLDTLPVKGKKKVYTYILCSVICYQLIVLYNKESHRKLGAVKEILQRM